MSPTDATGWIVFSGLDWWCHPHGHSDFQLAQGLAATAPVLVVNSLSMRMPLPGRTSRPLHRIVRKARAMARGLRRPVADLPNFHVLSPVVVPWYGSAVGRRINARLVRGQVMWAARRVGLSSPNVMVTVPTAWDVAEDLPHARLVVNRCDQYSAFAESNGDVIRDLEVRMLGGADTVLYVSHELMRDEASLVAGHAVFLDHGVDLVHFDRSGHHRLPPDLAAIPRPRVGFYGMIDDYTVDLDLLDAVATELPDVALVLIGDTTQPLTTLLRHPNVHWLGARPYADIPRYAVGFDVALMPWLDNDWIRFCNPIKMKEYLALGLPVVSTWFPEVERYRDVVRVADDRAGFVAQIRAALADGADTAAVRASVRDASWSSRVGQLRDLVDA